MVRGQVPPPPLACLTRFVLTSLLKSPQYFHKHVKPCLISILNRNELVLCYLYTLTHVYYILSHIYTHNTMGVEGLYIGVSGVGPH